MSTYISVLNLVVGKSPQAGLSIREAVEKRPQQVSLQRNNKTIFFNIAFVSESLGFFLL